LSGFNGDLALAERYGQEALKIAQQAGDEWMAGLCMLALGIAQANTGRAALAMTTLSRAASTFTICGDSYNLALARLWLALVAIHQARTEEFLMHATSLFKMTRAQNYDFLFSKNTLFGPRQPSAVASILMEAKKQGIERDYITCLPTEVNLHKALSYPNYLLRIQALGPLRVWRGQDEIKDVGGKRLKARALFGLLITYRPELLHKEQIMDMLWPEASADAAYRNFRVTLNALNVSLQPERESYARPLYILRYGQSYGLNLAACYRLDVEEFESLVNKAACLEDTDDNNAIELYRQALELYKGDYLKDFLYEEWSSKERQRVTEVYLRAAEKLAHLLVKTQDYEGCIETCNRILAKDNCWEGAYRLLMSCYYKLGDRPAALRIYHECVESLQQELGVPPMSSTSHLYGRICQSAV
jgi:DNA-binding SARP family transcriptional activator